MKFLKYIGMVAGGLRKEGKHTTMENFLYAKKRLAGYLQSQGKKDVSTGEVDRELINGFCDYLVADGVGISTISSYLSIFRTTLNKASREGLATVLDKGENPFADMRIKPLRKTEGTAYGRDVYQKLQELDIRQQLLNGSDSPDTTTPRSMSALERNPQVPGLSSHKVLGPGISGRGIPKGPRGTRMGTGLS